jgi:uroporphyrinogen III methyltransferase/synthase
MQLSCVRQVLGPLGRGECLKRYTHIYLIMAEQPGTVYLVGAGPGHWTYLTLRAQELLTQAEVLVYDALVDKHIFKLVSPTCVQIDVGKRGGQPSTPQDTINQILVEHCQRGQQVVRLKGGDPFIFGRSAAEIDALKRSGCEVEVVPGISSALAAPLLAGIPLTDPVLSRCFAVLSAHDLEPLNWAALAQIETLVILMGTRNLPEIVEQLQHHGAWSKTPIAIIRWASHDRQQIWTGTVETIVQQTSRQALSPAVIVIGEVVRLRPYLYSPSTLHNRSQSQNKTQRSQNKAQNLRPQTVHQPKTPVANPLVTPPSQSQGANQNLPLMEKTILVTRSAAQSSEFGDCLRQQGARVLEMPALEIGPPSSWENLDRAIAHLSQFDWLILTSANGVNAFFERLRVQGRDARALSALKIAVVGKKTAQSLQNHSIQPDFIPPDFVADALVAHFPDRDSLQGLNVLFPRVETGGRDALVADFTAHGARVTEVAAYESRCPQTVPPEALTMLQSHRVDAITFTSSKTVKNFYQLLDSIQRSDQRSEANPSMMTTPKAIAPSVESLLEGVCLASIGPQTSAACQKWLGRVDVEAQDYTLDGLTEALVSWANTLNE